MSQTPDKNKLSWGTYKAYHRFRHHQYDQCLRLCDEILAISPLEQTAWCLKARSLTNKTFVANIDQLADIADDLLESHSVSTAKRPGTSLKSGRLSTANMAMRPVSMGGRHVTGYDRASRQTGKATARATAFNRLNTASLVASKGFIQLDKLNLEKYASKPHLARVLFDYIYHQLQNPTRAMELAKESDWWWKWQLGRCYYRLNLLRDAERHWKTSLEIEVRAVTIESLGILHQKLDQPNNAIELYKKYAELRPKEMSLFLARLYELMQDYELSTDAYKKVLAVDQANIEAISCIASNCFYSDQPEVSLALYKRLLQMGVDTPEVWSNLGLAAFYSQQLDMVFSCFDRAGKEGWYNLGHVMLNCGELLIALYCFSIAQSKESLNNIGVLEMLRNQNTQALLKFQGAFGESYEPFLNAGIACFKIADLKGAFDNFQKALSIYPECEEAKEMMKRVNDYIQ